MHFIVNITLILIILLCKIYFFHLIFFIGRPRKKGFRFNMFQFILIYTLTNHPNRENYDLFVRYHLFCFVFIYLLFHILYYSLFKLFRILVLIMEELFMRL